MYIEDINVYTFMYCTMIYGCQLIYVREFRITLRIVVTLRQSLPSFIHVIRTNIFYNFAHFFTFHPDPPAYILSDIDMNTS